MPQYAISDIHGHLATFKALLRRLDFNRDDELFLLGDFIDRGPDSKGVIDYIRELRADGHQVHCLRGNHEQMVLEAEWGNDSWRMWLRNGGKATCRSFGTYDEWYVPEEYVAWMSELPLYLSTKGYLFVHAGLDGRKEKPLEDQESLLWARDWYKHLRKEWLGGRIVVHGHTPKEKDYIIESINYVNYQPVINIDNGCFVPNRRGMGHLCALTLGTHALTFEERVG